MVLDDDEELIAFFCFRQQFKNIHCNERDKKPCWGIDTSAVYMLVGIPLGGNGNNLFLFLMHHLSYAANKISMASCRTFREHVIVLRVFCSATVKGLLTVVPGVGTCEGLR